jgi:ActR/RegA family two-component response regulator
LYRALLLDNDAAHAERLITQVLQPQSLVVDHVRRVEETIVKLQHSTNYYALVILNVSANGLPWHRALQKLQHACRRVNGQAASLFLCVSKTQKETEFILRIEHMGARFVYER